MTKEALKLALEALEAGDWYINQLEMIVYSVDDDGTHENRAKVQAAITAIKEALREHAMREMQRLGQEIEQEPVVGITAIRTWFKDGRVVTQTLCNSWVDTTPPKRKPLTDEQVISVWDEAMHHSEGAPSLWQRTVNVVRAIEAAHGIKE